VSPPPPPRTGLLTVAPTQVEWTTGPRLAALVLSAVAVVVVAVLALGLLLSRPAPSAAPLPAVAASPGLSVSPPVVPEVPSPTVSSVAPAPPALSPIHLVLDPVPASDFEGDRDVLEASGHGSVLTAPFGLRGGTLDGAMSQTGTGATFTLVRVGDTTAGTPTAECLNGCESGGWAGSGIPPQPGTYRLRVVADATTSWAFSLQERVSLPLVATVGTSSTGTSRLQAHGFGTRRSRPFHLAAGQPSLMVGPAFQASGGYSALDATTMYLVPAGHPRESAKDVVVSADIGSDGGVIFTVPAAGDYYLVVRTRGVWSIDVSVQ
jgi:hypothetical protein